MPAQKTALVVDDVAFARKVVKDILIDAKFTVIGEATNGAEAIALYKQLKPDFVTMDVVMPVKSGIEAARKIIEDDKNAKIIMISAIVHEQVLMEAINAGARDYIVKPFSAEDLLKAVDKALQGMEEGEGMGARGAAYGAG